MSVSECVRPIKRLAQFANSTKVNEDIEKLFILIALTCGLRGDAHLRKFGIVYDARGEEGSHRYTAS
jgi:hypothetical protein